jgi:hypothetical protein
MENPHLKKAILEIVENQLNANDPPETKKTLKRLMAAGYSREQAKEMIGTAVTGEIWEVLHNNKESDPQRYAALLDDLK